MLYNDLFKVLGFLSLLQPPSQIYLPLPARLSALGLMTRKSKENTRTTNNKDKKHQEQYIFLFFEGNPLLWQNTPLLSWSWPLEGYRVGSAKFYLENALKTSGDQKSLPLISSCLQDTKKMLYARTLIVVDMFVIIWIFWSPNFGFAFSLEVLHVLERSGTLKGQFLPIITKNAPDGSELCSKNPKNYRRLDSRLLKFERIKLYSKLHKTTASRWFSKWVFRKPTRLPSGGQLSVPLLSVSWSCL